MKESFVVYASQYDAMENLTDAEIGQIIRKLFLKITRDEEYSCDSKLADGIAKSFFPNIYAASRRYEANVANGKKGGAPKGNQNAKKQPKITQNQPMGCFTNVYELKENNPKTTENQPMDCFDNEKNNPKQPKNNLNDNENVNVNKNGNINDTVTRTTSNIYNQSIHEIEKEKIEDTVTRNTSNHPIIPIFKNKEIPKMKELLLEYKDNEGELREPTHDELLCVAYIEDLGFSKDDFKDNNYTNVNQIILAVASKVGKTLLKHGFKVSIDNKDYLDMLKNYLDANYNYFKISTSCF